MAVEIRTLSENERIDWLRLARSENVGSKTFFSLLALYGSAANALARVQEMSLRGGRKQPITLFSASDAKKEIAASNRYGATLIAACEPDFPRYLLEIKDCPPILTVRGNAALLNKSIIGIVGARNASANGCRFAEQLAVELGRNSLICASGLARGIDTAVHRGSLQTGTIGVIAGGIDNIYPKENEALYAAIAEKGVIVAELPFGAMPRSQHFPRRNRIISGLSQGVVVVEASLKSGSLITARMALEQNRDVFAVPGSPLDPRCKGTNDLIRQGAYVTESAQDVLNQINLSGVRAFSFDEKESAAFVAGRLSCPPDDLVAKARPDIIEKLGVSPVAVDELVRQLGIPANIILTVLLELELAGRLERHSGNRVSLIYSGTEDLFAIA